MKKKKAKNGGRRYGSERNLSLNKPQDISDNTGRQVTKLSRKLDETTVKLKKAKGELQASEKKYRQLVENANCIIIRRTVKG